jgi:hypothetical protein
VGRPVVVDTRRALDRQLWEAAGWQVWALGVDSPVAAATASRHRAASA